ncbi:hypothetical protein PWG15_24680 (plasmid) [Ensifer adhaerens]|uniref:hypothetical protein n=1 Tax=Ensifer adhaerens TaxID=106592 RepID=UPI0023AA123E|nr:hypothetical protein [Ensifer adhaerens]WDZ80951.1 hypothetical protein PWG15_24680 [Ensifer adhaerens]
MFVALTIDYEIAQRQVPAIALQQAPAVSDPQPLKLRLRKSALAQGRRGRSRGCRWRYR